MSAMTYVEQVLARASGRERVTAGDIVVARADLSMANDITAPLAIAQFERAGARHVADPMRVFIAAGRHAPFRDAASADQVQRVARFCAAQGIERFFGYGEGMDHVLAPEMGVVRPGMLICNADSHACTYGALGAVGVPFGSTDLAYLLAFGEIWMRVPATVRVEFHGAPGVAITTKDLVLAAMAKTGVDGARYMAVEFTGDALACFSVDERFTIANMAIEMGAKTGVMFPDAAVERYLEARAPHAVAGAAHAPVPVPVPVPHADAPIAHTWRIDVSALTPLVARPHLPSDVVAADSLSGVRVDQVNIGSCTNGRMVDLRQAADLLRGRRIARHVRLMVTPATAGIYRAALDEGLLAVFLDAGAVINPPGCGPCAGWHQGALAADEVCVATHNRNFQGRMGSKTAQVYLAGPLVAAASALAGEIADPTALLQETQGAPR
ncbi:MAG: 3-isopropylmalate dehydratase large subunit [Proteobacteria bacterium]|nr:3-isopropylmalate dehydratase large subunit [Burkholderiales bacterium]